ncbi:MAG: ATPase V [Bacteroidaceae bacterium]|nr:ATPase V [Bacteroidaceae bacterium]
MKKLTFLVYHKEYDRFLRDLQALGVMHIQKSGDQTMAEPESLRQLRRQKADVVSALDVLQKIVETPLDEIPVGDAGVADSIENAQAMRMVRRLEEIASTLVALTPRIASLQHDAEILRPWGIIDKSLLEKLHEAGIHEQYRIASVSHFAQKFPEYAAFEINRDKRFVYFLTFDIEGQESENIPAQSLQLPEKSLEEVEREIAELTQQKELLEAERETIAENQLGDIIALEKEIDSAIAREEATLKTQRAALDTVVVMEGWFPVREEEAISGFLSKEKTYYEMRDPVTTDNVPIQLRNNRFNRMFERLTRMYGFPCYNEWDPTPIVAPFFTLFFAICMGDAGYGIIIMLYGFLEMMGKARKTPIVGEMLHGCGDMVFALGAATTLVGLALGTFFGLSLINYVPDASPLHSYYAFVGGDFPGTSYSFQMAGAIIIGVVHLCIAMMVKAILFTQKEGLSATLSTWAWNLLLIGGIIVGTLSMVGTLSAEVTRLIVIAIGAVSAIGIYFLNNVGRLKSSPLKGILINPLAGLYETYNMASGLLGDVLSYVRLYALCLAGGALGSAFNQIGDMLAIKGGVLFICCAVVIYFIGHLLNLLLSAISAFVHPLRLNFVEYFKNSGYEGRGTGYEPLK